MCECWTEAARLDRDFAAAMDRLGPFARRPRLAAAVSGGADSMALALLADRWVRSRDGSLLALVVDHGLRPASAREAADTVARLARCGIAARLLTLTGLARGTAMAERARAARYRILNEACRTEGILELLVGHHAADQTETLMIRMLSGSRDRGLAGMPGLAETRSLRLLRPLLGVMPARLRGMLTGAGIAWVEDPSNTDIRALRPRLRQLRHGHDDAAATLAVCGAARGAGERRAAHEQAMAGVLAERISIRPEGFAVMPSGPVPADVLAAVIQALSGDVFSPAADQVAALAAAPRPATLGGVRLLPAGKLGPGLLLVREEAAMAPPVPAVPGAVWDRRFRLTGGATLPAGTEIGPLGPDASVLRRLSRLPSAVLRTLPALRRANVLVAVPHLSYPSKEICAPVRLVFSPARPMAGAQFLPALVSIPECGGDA